MYQPLVKLMTAKLCPAGEPWRAELYALAVSHGCLHVLFMYLPFGVACPVPGGVTCSGYLVQAGSPSTAQEPSRSRVSPQCSFEDNQCCQQDHALIAMDQEEDWGPDKRASSLEGGPRVKLGPFMP